MKFLILGDIHLGKGISIGKPAELDKLNSRIQDQIDLLDWAYEKCIKDDQLEHIIITGDVFQDYKPHPAVIGIFLLWLKKCERSNIKVYIIMGNHDILRSGQWIVSAVDLVTHLEFENAVVYKKIFRLDVGNYTIVFVPFRDKRMYETKDGEEALQKLKNELNEVCKEPSDKIKVAIGHLALEGSLVMGTEISDMLNEIFVPPEVFGWFDYVWMGHIHHPQVIQHYNPYIAHIGSLDRSDFSKTEVNNEKIAIILDDKSDKFFTEIVLPTRPLRPIKIDVPPNKDSTEFVINELCLLSKTLAFEKAIVRLDVQLNGAELESVQRDKIESYLIDNLGVFHVCGFSETRVMSSIEINPEDSFDNTMDIDFTINKWADTRDFFDTEDDKLLFKKFAHEVREEYEEKCKK